MKRRFLMMLMPLAALACVLNACGGQSTAQGSTDAAPAATQPPAGQPGPNERFYAVQQKLDVGGSFYLYSDLRGNLKEFVDMLRPYVMQPGMPPQALRIHAVADKVLDRLGMYGVHDLGVSVTPEEGELNRTKFYLSTPEGRQKGILAMLGGEPHPLAMLDRASSATLLMASGDFDTAAAWALVRQVATDIGGVNGTATVDKAVANFKDQLGLDIEAIIASLGGDCTFLVDQDPAFKLVVPLGGAPIMIDSPRLALMARVKDATLYESVKALLQRKGAPVAPEATDGKLKYVAIQAPPNPVWVVAPAWAFDGEYVYLSTHIAMIKQLSAPAGPALRANPDYQRMAAGLPTAGNAVSYVSPRLGAVINQVIEGFNKARPQMGGARAAEPAMANAMLKMAQKNASTGAISVRVNEPGGVLVVSRSSAGAAQYMGAMLVAPAAILAAIAVPNFLEAQTRSKVARVRGDMRTMAVALETYYLDNNGYPAWATQPDPNANGTTARTDQPTFRIKRDANDQLMTLTTPISYISSYFSDPFADFKGTTFSYWTPKQGTGFIIWSPGPDGKYDLTMDNIAELYDPTGQVPSPELIKLTFDPSNGTKSNGDVYRYKQ